MGTKNSPIVSDTGHLRIWNPIIYSVTAVATPHEARLHGNGYRALSCHNGGILCQLLENRTSLVQASLVHRLGFRKVMHRTQERSLMMRSSLSETHSSPEPMGEPLDHASNKRRDHVL